MINALTITVMAMLLSIIFSIIYDYLTNQESKELINKIKRVIFSPRQANKITQIKNLLVDFFIEEN